MHSCSHLGILAALPPSRVCFLGIFIVCESLRTSSSSFLFFVFANRNNRYSQLQIAFLAIAPHLDMDWAESVDCNRKTMEKTSMSCLTAFETLLKCSRVDGFSECLTDIFSHESAKLEI